MRRVILIHLLVTGIMFAAAIEQPLPFSHKQHSTLGLKCQECHANAGGREHMGFPATSKCMACHVLIAKEKPDIKKLAEYAKSKDPIPWKRVYQLPDYVFFSHGTHLAANAKCETCHGAVTEQAVIVKTTSRFMPGCVSCHQRHNASADCGTCHENAR
ncbi:MAG TPA: cytochrome c3 family protein [Bryobacteraceae bacterium]|jgi:hypothetical protein